MTHVSIYNSLDTLSWHRETCSENVATTTRERFQSQLKSINTRSAASFVGPKADKDKSKFLFIDYEDLKSERNGGLWQD